MDRKDLEEVIAAIKATAPQPAPVSHQDAYTQDKNKAFNWVIPVALIGAVTAIVGFGIYLHQRDDIIEDMIDKERAEAIAFRGMMELQVETIKDQTHQTNKQIEQINAKLSSPRFTLDNFIQQIKPMEQMVQRHDVTLMARDKRIDKVEDKSTKMEITLENHESEIMELEKKIDSIERRLAK